MNFQKPIIFCVLLVTVAVVESADSNIEAGLSVEERFDYFAKFLNDSVEAVNRYSLIHLIDTSVEFQGECLKSFEDKMILSTLDYNSENAVRLREMAFQSFEETVRNTIRGFQRLIKRQNNLLFQIQWLLEKGDVLHFLSYLNHLEIPENDLKNEMKRLQKEHQGCTEVEARYMVILIKYNRGEIKNDYPKKCGGGGLKRMLSHCVRSN